MITARQFLVGLALVAVGSAGGSAITASNTLPNTTAGYGSSTISGATATSIVYTLSADGTEINVVTLLFTGNLTSGKVVKAGFGTDALSSCTIGAYSDPNTTVTCSGFSQSTSTASAFNVAVTNS
jgi:hypothetical protein